ncbi:MAG: DUF305 domain-containing protein [Actinobacteria bacterium]|nr:DUF305 domain-containing protein [Actinomycetota bacterium]
MKRFLIALVALVGLTGCSAADNSHMGMHDEKYNGAAIMFAQMMIPHHEQAIELSNLAIKISTGAEILSLASQIKSEQSPEIKQMETWLESVGMPDMHHMMEMPGFVEESDFAALKKLTGAEFDIRFLELMIGHHEGAIEMAQDIKGNTNSEVKALSDEIISSQTAEITEMKNLIKDLS